MGVLANIARMVTATTGTGTVTLGVAAPSFLTFAAAGISDGQTVSYAIEDGLNREVGQGVYSSSGPTLTRTVVASTNGGAAISLSGTAQVFISAIAEDLAYLLTVAERTKLSFIAVTQAVDLDALEAKADSALQLAAIGTSVQAYDADLTTWAGITPATGVGAFLATPTSANLRAALTDEVGTGAAYFVGGALGTPASATLTNATGLPIIAGTSGTLTVARGGTGLTAAGTNGNIIMSNGTGFVSIPFPALPPRTVTSTLTAPFALATAATWTDTGLTVTITPSSISSRVFLQSMLSVGHSNAGGIVAFRLVRGATAIAQADTAGTRTTVTSSTFVGTASQGMESAGISYVDAPATVAAITYKLQMRIFVGAGYLNRSHDDGDSAPFFRGISTLTAIEVSA